MRIRLPLIAAVLLSVLSCTKEQEVSMEVDKMIVSISGEGAETTVYLKTDSVGWETSSDQQWLTVTPASGYGNAFLNIRAAKNNVPSERSGNVFITDVASGAVFKVMVNQAAGEIPDGPDDPEDPDDPDDPDDPEEPDYEEPDDPAEPIVIAPSGDQPGWFELPKMNISMSGNYMVNSDEPTQYYAWHICPDLKYGGTSRYARNYTVCFDSDQHVPLWVAAPRHSSYTGSSGRSGYSHDPNIPKDLQYNGKDTGGDCNKGHMLGSAERTVSSATNKQVFYYTNIAPQLQYNKSQGGGFNTGGGGWNTLEDWVDGQVCRDTLYVVIGTYFGDFTDGYGKKATYKRIEFGGRDDVGFPTMFYYVLLRTKGGSTGKSLKDCSASEMQCAAFCRSHVYNLHGQSVTKKEMMSVSALEQVTGVTYFTNLPQAPKNVCNPSDWGL